MPKKLDVVQVKEQTVAQRIREIREAKGLTQIEVASRANISQATLSLIEIGRAKITLELCVALAEALGCSIDYLIGRDLMTVGSPTDQLMKAFEQMDKLSQGLFIECAKTHVLASKSVRVA